MTMLPSRIARPECVPPPTVDASVSRVMKPTFSNGTPSHSVTSCAKLVSWPWPVRYGADHELDPAVGLDRHLGALARNAGRGIDVIGDADAALSCRAARFGACAPAKPSQSRERQRAVHDRAIVAAVVDQAERIACRACALGRHEIAPPQRDAVEAVSRAAISISRSITIHRPRAGRRCDRAVVGAVLAEHGAARGNGPPACDRCST